MRQVYAIAKTMFGLTEITGKLDNPAIVAMFAKVGHPQVKDDETSWCAAFVGACLIDAGLQSTRRLDARSYLNWGVPVELKDAQPGDVVVLWRESPKSWKGHVGFYHGRKPGFVQLLGGNQSNRVSVESFSTSRILGIRRAAEVPAPTREVLKELVGEGHGGFWAGLAASILEFLNRRLK